MLESVLRRVWEHFIPNEPIGTRPLEEVIQRLQKNGYLPRKQAAYAIAVKELGNVGTHVHDEKVDKADVVQALSPLISVLEWYFEQDWVEGAASANLGAPAPPPDPLRDRDRADPAAGPAGKPPHFVRVAVASAVMLTLIIIAGSIAFFRGRTVEPTAPPAVETSPRSTSQGKTDPPVVETDPRSDQERIQGRWQAVNFVVSLAKKKAPTAKPVWNFRGTHLTMHGTGPYGTGPDMDGSFSLSLDGTRKLFDFRGTRPNGEPLEIRGIYEFEDDYLKIGYMIRSLDPTVKNFKRPDSFVVPLTTAGTQRYAKFERIGG